MPILNESEVFARQPEEHRKAFVRHTAVPVRLEAQTWLYKFTGAGVAPGKAGVGLSPWWAVMYPRKGTSDLGLDGHIAAAKAAGLPMLKYARDAFAVMYAWNSLGVAQSGFATAWAVQLLKPVVAFAGLVHSQREKVPDGRKVIGTFSPLGAKLKAPTHQGGAYQYYIPNLTPDYFSPCKVFVLP